MSTCSCLQLKAVDRSCTELAGKDQLTDLAVPMGLEEARQLQGI